MEEISTSSQKRMQIEMMRNIHDFCKKNNISYYMCGGTLLGAVRHKGFIPWDDDIDISIPRNDYIKFIKNFNSENYKIASIETVKNFPFPYAKVYDIRTKLVENCNNKTNIGLFIDVFPMDYLPVLSLGKCKNVFFIKILLDMYFLKSVKIKKERNILKNIILFFSHILFSVISFNRLSKSIIKLAQKHNTDNKNYIGVLVWGKQFLEMGSIELFKPILLDFENLKLYSPEGYDAYLKKKFGNYMKLPPKNQQISHHDIKIYRID